MALLAEAIEEEVQGINTYDQKIKTGLVISTGSVMLAGYIWTRVNRDTRGMRFGSRIFKSIIPNKGNFLKKFSVNMLLLSSVASTFWLGHQLSENYNQKNLLAALIKKINRIKDLTGEIIMLSNKIDNDQVLLDMKIEELEDQGIIEYNDGEINCIN